MSALSSFSILSIIYPSYLAYIFVFKVWLWDITVYALQFIFFSKNLIYQLLTVNWNANFTHA